MLLARFACLSHGPRPGTRSLTRMPNHGPTRGRHAASAYRGTTPLAAPPAPGHRLAATRGDLSLSAVTGRTRPVLLRRQRRPFFRRLPSDGRINACPPSLAAHANDSAQAAVSDPRAATHAQPRTPSDARRSDPRRSDARARRGGSSGARASMTRASFLARADLPLARSRGTHRVRHPVPGGGAPARR